MSLELQNFYKILLLKSFPRIGKQNKRPFEINIRPGENILLMIQLCSFNKKWVSLM